MDAMLNRITDYLQAQSWQIAVLVAIIALISWVLRHRSAHVRYLLWLIVVAKCLIPPIVNVPLPVLPEPTTQTAVPIVASSGPDRPAVTPSAPARLTPQISSTVETVQPQLGTRQWLAVVWLAGMGFFALAAAIKAVRTALWLRRQRQPIPNKMQVTVDRLLASLGLKRLPRMWLIEGVGQPFVWGFARGDVYLPCSFLELTSDEHRKSVLGHEVGHVLRFDAAVNILQIIAQTLFWFHPLVWWANKRIRTEREKCCDEMAVALLDAKAKEYSAAIVNTLIQEQASRRPAPSLAIAGPAKNIEERIRAMLRPGKRFYKHPGLTSITLLLLLALVIVPSALVLSVRATEKTSSAKENAVESAVTPAEEKYLERLKEAFAQGITVDRNDLWEHTLLHRTCMEGYAKVAEFLIDKGADVNAGNITGITPLHTAAGRGHAEVVKLLLDKGADVNARDNYDATPLWYAKNGVVYTFDTFGRFWNGLIAQWNPENPGCVKAAALLGERGGVAHAPVLSLHEAALYGRLELVKSRLAEGADVKATDDRLAGTPLHLAAYSNQIAVVKFLIAHGADVNARNKWDRTPLHMALDQKHTEVAELLRKHGARLEPATEAARVKTPTSLFESATSKSAIPKKCLKIPEPMQACAANLHKIRAAIKKYEQDKGQLPAWLSDLVPNYVSKEMLMCPSKPKALAPFFKDPVIPCGYIYEFSPSREYARFGGAPTDGMTQRDRAILQVALVGDVVPLCRCRQHGQMWLNISVGGKVYVTGPAWLTWIMPDYKVGDEISKSSSR